MQQLAAHTAVAAANGKPASVDQFQGTVLNYLDHISSRLHDLEMILVQPAGESVWPVTEDMDPPWTPILFNPEAPEFVPTTGQVAEVLLYELSPPSQNLQEFAAIVVQRFWRGYFSRQCTRCKICSCQPMKCCCEDGVPAAPLACASDNWEMILPVSGCTCLKSRSQSYPLRLQRSSYFTCLPANPQLFDALDMGFEMGSVWRCDWQEEPLGSSTSSIGMQSEAEDAPCIGDAHCPGTDVELWNKDRILGFIQELILILQREASVQRRQEQIEEAWTLTHGFVPSDMQDLYRSMLNTLPEKVAYNPQ